MWIKRKCRSKGKEWREKNRMTIKELNKRILSKRNRILYMIPIQGTTMIKRRNSTLTQIQDYIFQMMIKISKGQLNSRINRNSQLWWIYFPQCKECWIISIIQSLHWNQLWCHLISTMILWIINQSNLSRNQQYRVCLIHTRVYTPIICWKRDYCKGIEDTEVIDWLDIHSYSILRVVYLDWIVISQSNQPWISFNQY